MIGGALTTALNVVDAAGSRHVQLSLLAASTPSYWPSWQGYRIKMG
jgi:hypothetical protein